MSTTSTTVPAGLRTEHVLINRVRARWRVAWTARRVLNGAALALALAIGLVLVDQLLSLPAGLRAVLRVIPAAVLLGVILHAVRGAWPGPSTRRLALLLEEHRPALRHHLSTLLDATGDGPVVRAFRARALRDLGDAAEIRIPLRLERPARRLGVALIAGLLLPFAVPGGAAELTARWLHLVPDPATGIGPTDSIALGIAAADARVEFRALRIRIDPPAYTGLPSVETDPTEPMTALAGSTLHLSGVAPAGAALSARVLGGGLLDVRADGDGFAFEHVLGTGDRGLELVARADAEILARRVLPLQVVPDAPPVVELLAPDEDMVVATPSGTIAFAASARDDHGIADFRLAWILSRGSGESFSFTDGGAEWDGVQDDGGRRVGRFALDLAELGLQPGDVLHVRAVARDGNTLSGPGEGVSQTRLVRIAREDAQDEATTLIGFPMEPEKDPVLSQRMIILLTERLLERRATLTDDAYRAEADGIAHQQARLRERLADIIFARSSGEDASHGAADLSRPLSAAPDSLSPAERARRMQEVLEAASRATGQGTLEELSHSHDPDPALAVNLPLLPAFNAMYDAERELRQAELRAALPHEHRALEIIQRVREAERVYLRGRQTVPPVDVAAARGTGDIDDAVPTARRAAGVAKIPDAHVAAITAAAAELRDAPRRAALTLSALSASLLEDADVDRAAGTLLAAAAEAARRGERDDALDLIARARGVLAPAAGAAARSVATPLSGAGAAFLAALRSGATASATHADVRTPFVFATARYASGDWDSGQLVPANLIHSLALYTDIPVAPEGVVVDLASPELFAYPFVHLTGHLPVRFSAAEAANLRSYVERGGFLFIDDHNHDIDGAFHRTVTAELERIFGPDALRPLPKEHELYGAFFVFEEGPPTTSHELNGWGDGLVHEQLFAVVRDDGRIGVLYSNKDYTSEWSYHVQNKRFLSLDNTRFGVNAIVYALTR